MFAMKKFERPPLADCQRLVRRLHGKSVDETIATLGPPARELGPESNERNYCDGRTEVVQFLRTLEFLEVDTTIHSLLVFERSDGKLELNFRGKELEPDEKG